MCVCVCARARERECVCVLVRLARTPEARENKIMATGRGVNLILQLTSYNSTHTTYLIQDISYNWTRTAYLIQLDTTGLASLMQRVQAQVRRFKQHGLHVPVTPLKLSRRFLRRV
jgi:hypothetical protein